MIYHLNLALRLDIKQNRYCKTRKNPVKSLFVISVIFLSLLTASTAHSQALSQTNSTAHFYGGEVTDARKLQLIEQVKQSAIQPANEHPRLYGTNAQWYQTIQKFEALDANCDWQGIKGSGTIKNIKSEWDYFTLGGETCLSNHKGVPANLQEHKVATKYLNNTISKWSRNDAFEMVHLIRRMNYCHEIEENCAYSQADINTLSQAFLSYEISRLRSSTRNNSGYLKVWHRGNAGRFFDLGSYPGFKLWTLILDTFWHSTYLQDIDRQFVLTELENEIDSYIEIYNLPADASGALGRWAIHNGNNWTPILNSAALFWAITLWHEEGYVDKTRQVLDIVLESNWLHRKQILDDGAYTEGTSYLGTSMTGSLEINNLLMASFGQPNHAVKWALMAEKTSSWMLKNIAPDGKFVDFGDSWARDGFSDLQLMDMAYWQELVGLSAVGTTSADACTLQEYFSKSYFLHAFYDPWKAAPHYARDFYSLTAPCNKAFNASTTLVYPTYKMGILTQELPGATQTAQDVNAISLRNLQADQTYLAGNGVDNALPHREIDFGALIWAPLGNRLLSDWGYGELSKSYEFFKITGAKGEYIANNTQSLEFFIKHISGALDISKLYVNLKVKSLTKELPLNDYITELDSDWLKVSIPLTDFSLSDSDWEGSGEGIETVRFVTKGFVINGEFGLDEIKIVDAQGNDSKLWYGDMYSESMSLSEQSVTPYIRRPKELQLSALETSNGADGSANWARFSASSQYASVEIYYKNNVDNIQLANYMDYLPIGANTLILPKAQDETALRPENTHMSQFKDQTGLIHALDVAGKSAIHMNGSAVYGRGLENGNLAYFHRYLIPLNGGHFVVVDSFKAKTGKDDHIQEFWYSQKGIIEDDDLATFCHARSQHVSQQVNAEGALLLTPSCNPLTRDAQVESYGKIQAASLHPGSFVLGAPEFMREHPYFNRFIEDDGLYMINRVKKKETRNLARYMPENAVNEDVRVFLLQSSTSTTFGQSSVTKTDCATGVCFNVTVQNASGDNDSIDLVLEKVQDQYVLAGTNLSAPDLVDVIPKVEHYGVLLMPTDFAASHPDRVGAPENWFNEQSSLDAKPEEGAAYPRLLDTVAAVNRSSSNSSVLPQKLSVASTSNYPRHIYVDENGEPLSARFTFTLDKVSEIYELMYYDISSSLRPGAFKVWTSLDNQTWSLAYDGSSGVYKKWASIVLNNVEAQYIQFELLEQNAAVGITELLIYGKEKQAFGPEQLITPTLVESLHPERLRNFAPLFDEQQNITEKPEHLAKLPELRASRPKVNLSNTNDLPLKKAVATESIYGRVMYVDANDEPMHGTIIIELGELYQLTDLYFYDMSSGSRPAPITMSYSTDKSNWSVFYDDITQEYKNWVNVPLPEGANAAYIKLDFPEQNSATAMTEMLIYGKKVQ